MLDLIPSKIVTIHGAGISDVSLLVLIDQIYSRIAKSLRQDSAYRNWRSSVDICHIDFLYHSIPVPKEVVVGCWIGNMPLLAGVYQINGWIARKLHAKSIQIGTKGHRNLHFYLHFVDSTRTPAGVSVAHDMSGLGSARSVR